MSYNGSGTFVINSANQPVVTGQVISASVFNALTADLAGGLTMALTKDGQTTPTGNIPLGGYKLTGVGNPTVAGDALTFSANGTMNTLTLLTPLSAANGGTGLTSLGPNVANFLQTPTSTNFAAAVTGGTGTGSVVFSASPTFTGIPLAPTASNGTSNTQIATTQFVANAVAASTTGVSSFNTRTGAVTLTSTDVTTALGNVPVDWLNVKFYGAVGNGSTDDKAAINLAIAAANISGASVYFPAGTYKVSGALDSVTKEGVTLRGDGPRASIIAMASATGNTVTLGAGAQFSSVRDLAFIPSVFRTSGSEILITGGFLNVVYNVAIYYGYRGVSVVSTASALIDNLTMRYMTGDQGLTFEGTVTTSSYGLYVKNVVADNPYVTAPTATNVTGAFQATYGYTANQLFTANGWVWQVTTAGTSGASGPAAPTTTNWYTTSVSNGAGALMVRAICNTQLAWVYMNNYANSITMVSAALLNGGYGFRMADAANTGTSYPSWAFFYDLEADHSYTTGVSLIGGLGFHATGSWIGSVLAGNGVDTSSNWLGEFSIDNSRVVGNAQNGILIGVGSESKVSNNFLCNNSTSSSGSYHGVAVAANINRFTISDNSVGRLVGLGSTNQAYGVYVNAGTSDYYTLNGNLGEGASGNVTGTLYDGGTGIHKSVFGDYALTTSYLETVYAISDAAGVAINPLNGNIQTWTLGASRTPTNTGWASGASVTLMVAATSYAITWSSMPITWVGGTAPTLSATVKTVIELWMVGSTIYGALVGFA